MSAVNEFPKHKITADVTPGSYLTEPMARWLRRRGAVSVTITEDDARIIAFFQSDTDYLAVVEILSSSNWDQMFRELR